uniref:C2H2-type domain-containing protein n=1 Tax=Daphnia galeata TaxID=27404 RepID=A0A8J2W2U6_9CRUS|nr:unnamed protein product [Daphnia galeata]
MHLVKHVAKDWGVVAHACRTLSKELEVSKDGNMVRRVTLLPQTDEGASPSRAFVAIGLAVDDASIARVAEMFNGVGQHGAIALIRILRPGHTLPPDVRQCAARHQDILTSICAVVEFEQAESARAALEDASALMPAGVKLVALFSRQNGSNGPEPTVPELFLAEPEPSTSTGITRTVRAEKLRQLVEPIFPLGRGNRLAKSLPAKVQEVRRNVAALNRGSQPAPIAGPAANRVGKQSTMTPAPKQKSIHDGNPLEGARGGAEEATARPAVGTAAGKPYKCTECPKSFKTSWLRKRHVMYRHTKEKPHQCPKCDYECVERSKIKRHINSMHKHKNPTGGVKGGLHLTQLMRHQLVRNLWLPNIHAFGWDSNIRRDQQSALISQLYLQPGQAKMTYGTGGFMLYNTGIQPVQSEHGLITTVAYQFGKNRQPHYAMEVSISVAGLALNWLKNNLNLISDFQECEKLAAPVTSTGGVYFVPAFSGLYAP